MVLLAGRGMRNGWVLGRADEALDCGGVEVQGVEMDGAGRLRVDPSW